VEQSVEHARLKAQTMATQQNNDQLLDMIESRNRVLEEYAESGHLDEGGPNSLEASLAAHIQQKIKLSHEKMEQQLGEDDIVDYLLVGILLAVAGVGFYMWRKVKQQEKTYLL